MKKLFTTFAVLAGMTLLISAISIISLRWTVRAKDQALERYAGIEVRIERLSALGERRARKLRTYLLTGDPSALMDRAQALGEFQATLAQIEAEIDVPEEAQLVRVVEDASARLVPVANALIELKSAGATDEEIDRAFRTRLQPARADLDEAMETLLREVKQQNAQQVRAANRRVASATILLGSTVGLALLSAIFLGFTLQRSVRELAAEKEALARAARYQEQVMGIVGHDIRSPLSAIIATASVAARTTRSAEDMRRNERILRSARRIDALAAVLIDFTRLQVSGRIPLVPQEGDIHALVNSQVAHLRKQQSNGTRIEHEIAGDGRAMFDWDRLGQAVEILLQQVVTYARTGATVRVRSRGEESSIVIEVAASGPPMAGTLLARMFEPFGLGDGDEPVVLSRGFSLYLARELVTAHSGTIDVRSDPDHGIMFRIHLPRSPRTQLPGGVLAELESARGSAARDGDIAVIAQVAHEPQRRTQRTRDR
jgi:signal transduction histidine kinase